MTTPPLSWCAALESEFEALHGVPPLDGSAPAAGQERLHAVHRQIHQRGPRALCLSGGGIRSATFALGVLQGLAHIGALGQFDYLSTVSGGGYTGGWLTAWLHRRGPSGRAAVFDRLNPDTECAAFGTQASPVERVRRTCRYLAPRGGVVSADVWTLAMTLARNLILNWFVIIPLLAATLLIPRLYYAVLHAVESPLAAGACAVPDTAWIFGGASLAAFAVCAVYVVLSFGARTGGWSQGRFLTFFLTPAVVGAIAMTLFWAANPCPLPMAIVGVIAVVPAVTWLVLGRVAIAGRGHDSTGHRDGSRLRVRPGLQAPLAALAAGAFLGFGIRWLGNLPFGFGAGEPLRELFAVAAVPGLLALVLLAMMLFVGLASDTLDDAALEWWSRAGAWIGIAAALWVAGSLLVFYTADLIEAGVRYVTTLLEVDHVKSSAVFAALVPLLSSLAGLAARGDSPTEQPKTLLALLQVAVLPIVILLLLSSIAWANLRASEIIEYHPLGSHPEGGGLGETLMLLGGLLAFGLVMSYFVPANRFSLHGMYRQRLVRTFLGASREDRHPNAFTGFDGNDDLCVHDLDDVRPLHVINATLNAVSSTQVGRHEQQSESFTFSPLHVGNQVVGYRRASEYGSDRGGPGTGLSLGMAIAVSGAAASPAMGIFSSKARAFLLTLANARLGLWFGNPMDQKTWQNSEPPLGVGPVVREMLGLTTDNNPYVYLSDGGHYDNLGLWQMVARRCRLIVISDAGCDPSYTFDDLSNAVRRIRLDLGVPILFPALDMSREGQGRTNAHSAIGTIHYRAVDGTDAPDGTILYLKATLSGDEPVDVRNFAALDPTFPHDSTGNQFFDEARFESYRVLGFHTVTTVAAGSGAAVFDQVRGVR